MAAQSRLEPWRSLRCDDDERLFAFHVGFDGFPHAGGFAVGFDAGERALFDRAIGVAHYFAE